jgi:hypothetical protein
LRAREPVGELWTTRGQEEIEEEDKYSSVAKERGKKMTIIRVQQGDHQHKVMRMKGRSKRRGHMKDGKK